MKRLVCGVNLAGTESFREASNESPEGYGTNIHTIPDWQRESFYSPLEAVPSGWPLGGFDMAQIEARIVADRARCLSQIELFEDPTRHAHIEQANRIGKILGWAQVKKGTNYYRLAKETVHGGNYDEGYITLAKRIGAKRKDASLLLNAYHHLYPEIRGIFHVEVVDEVKRTGKLVTPFGHERTFHAAISAWAYLRKLPDPFRKEIISWYAQTIAPYITNQGMKALWNKVPEARILLQHHDSIIFTAPPDVMRYALEDVILPALKVPITIHGRTFVIPAEPTVGWPWGRMMEYTGSVPSYEEWSKYRDEQDSKRAPLDRMLGNVYGELLGGRLGYE